MWPAWRWPARQRPMGLCLSGQCQAGWRASIFYAARGAANPIKWDTDSTVISEWIWMDIACFSLRPWVSWFGEHELCSVRSPFRLQVINKKVLVNMDFNMEFTYCTRVLSNQWFRQWLFVQLITLYSIEFGPSRTSFSEIWINIQNYSLKNMKVWYGFHWTHVS